MKSAIFAAAALVGAVNAWGNSSTYATPSPTTYETTEVVTSYTTYCPYATSVVQGNVTYTATSVSSGWLKLQTRQKKKKTHNTDTASGYHLDNHQLPMHSYPQDDRHSSSNLCRSSNHPIHNHYY